MKNPNHDLASHPLLNGISPAGQSALLQHSVVHTVNPGTLLFEQGEIPNFQIVVLRGSVHLLGRASTGPEVLIEVVESPDLVIPAAVLTQSAYLMRARAPESCRLWMIQAAAFRDTVSREPSLALAVIGDLSGQFRRMVRQIKNLKLRSVKERVGCYLLALSHRQGTPLRAALPYEKNLIASELGMTRESLSRTLSALQHDGITVEGDIIHINDPAQLASVCKLDPLIDGQDVFQSLID